MNVGDAHGAHLEWVLIRSTMYGQMCEIQEQGVVHIMISDYFFCAIREQPGGILCRVIWNFILEEVQGTVSFLSRMKNLPSYLTQGRSSGRCSPHEVVTSPLGPGNSHR